MASERPGGLRAGAGGPCQYGSFPCVAGSDGSLTRLLKKLARVDLLAVDDWGLTPLQPDQYRLFLEILDDRTGATLLTSQYPINTWHELVGDPTVGDAILDRLVHNAYKIELDGDSLRKKKAKAK